MSRSRMGGGGGTCKVSINVLLTEKGADRVAFKLILCVLMSFLIILFIIYLEGGGQCSFQFNVF